MLSLFIAAISMAAVEQCVNDVWPSIIQVLTSILQLEEFKRSTDVCKNVLSTAYTLTTLETEEKKTLLLSLVISLRLSYLKMLEQVQKYRLISTKLDKLWVLFHKFSTRDGIQLCKNFDTSLSLGGHDVFWQLLMEMEFIESIKDLRSVYAGSSESSTSATIPRRLTDVEINAILYTAGFVIKKLLKKYCKKKTQKEVECSRALNEMASRAKPTVGSGHYEHSKTWISLVNRGGLFHANDAVLDLFIAIELKTDEELSSIFEQQGKGISKVKKENISWLTDDEEVQSVWSLVSTSIIEEDVYRQELLKEICFLWVTTRGHSKAHQAKNDFKKSKAQATKGKKSLRKELAPQPREQN